jgi:PEP-CTERM motif
MSRLFRPLAALACAFAMLPGLATATTAVIQNGTFEAGLAPLAPSFSVSAGGVALPGWAVLQGQVDVINLQPDARVIEGNWSVDVDSGGIGQSFAALAGTTYYVELRHRTSVPGQAQIMLVRLGYAGGDETLLQFNTAADGSVLNQGIYWTPSTQSARASFSIQGSGPNPGGVVDSIVMLSPVPEPGTWALMLAGLGVVGLAARRRAAQISATRTA